MDWPSGAPCPIELHVLELGVGNGNQARVWLDTFVEIDRESGRDYYRRLHYLMGDYSQHLLDVARAQLRHHEEHTSAIVLDATRPSSTLGFLKYKTFFVYISNVYDNLPTDEIARIDGHLFQVETRAFLAVGPAETIAASVGATVRELPDLIARLLRLGPELLGRNGTGALFRRARGRAFLGCRMGGDRPRRTLRCAAAAR